MKLTIAVPALILAFASTGAMAQGIEGHIIGYTADTASTATYSARNATTKSGQEYVEFFADGQARAEDHSDTVVTVYSTRLEDINDRVFTR
tara:strand:+ start:1537 stop:1809 length:273 start_codon:yes stop_codon:yes gene_type:complete